jgi:hypothetical protein
MVSRSPGVRNGGKLSGACVDRALANAHEAEVGLLRMAPDPDLFNKGLYTLSHARLSLKEEDMLLRRLETGRAVQP